MRFGRLLTGATLVLLAATISISAADRAPHAGSDRAAVTDRLLGTWRLESETLYDQQGNAAGSLYHDAVGKLTYTSRGDVWAFVGERHRSGTENALWYTGTFEVRPNARKVVHHVQYSSAPSYEGGDLVRTYRFRDNRHLALSTPLGSQLTLVLRWAKAGAGWGKP